MQSLNNYDQVVKDSQCWFKIRNKKLYQVCGTDVFFYYYFFFFQIFSNKVEDLCKNKKFKKYVIMLYSVLHCWRIFRQYLNILKMGETTSYRPFLHERGNISVGHVVYVSDNEFLDVFLLQTVSNLCWTSLIGICCHLLLHRSVQVPATFHIDNSIKICPQSLYIESCLNLMQIWDFILQLEFGD